MRRLSATLLLVAACAPAAEPAPRGLAVGRILGGEAQPGYERAEGPRPFVFPRDHGPHPGFRSEWWYFTGNLEAAAGRRFGFQLTFFRFALAPPAATAQRPSRWATRQVYMAHFALTDVDAGRFHAFERFRRPVLGLAGAGGSPLAVWLDHWRLQSRGAELFPLRLRAHEGTVGLDLELHDLEGPVLQGDRGYSRKGPEAGNASFYYSYRRLGARGTVAAANGSHEVAGEAWLDREWSTSALGEDVEGWDWFALQLDDGRELMLYRLRRRDGTASPWNEGKLVTADGSARRLAAGDFALEVLASWRSDDGVSYPGRWRLAIPAEKLELTVTPRLRDQELRLTVRYWEGAVEVRGRSAGRPVHGQGYAELTGYAADTGSAEARVR